MTKTCGKPAVYVGYLNLNDYHGLTTIPAMNQEPVVNGPFCDDCTLDPRGWHRQFVSRRRAIPYDGRCTVPV